MMPDYKYRSLNMCLKTLFKQVLIDGQADVQVTVDLLKVFVRPHWIGGGSTSASRTESATWKGGAGHVSHRWADPLPSGPVMTD